MSVAVDLLVAVCRHGSTSTFRDLKEEYFIDEEEQALYEAVRHHFRQYNRFPSPDTVEDHLGYLPEVDEPVEYYRDQVVERDRYNTFRDHYQTIRDALAAGNMDVEAAYEAAHAMSRDLQANGVRTALMTSGQVADLVIEEYEYNHARPGHSGVATGWEFLDRQTSGYQNGDLVVWVARPAMGKTWLLVHQAHAAWVTGSSALFVSMEMTLPQVGRRFAAYHAGVDPDLVRRGQLSTWGRRKLGVAAHDMNQDARLQWFAGGMSKKSEQIYTLIQETAPDIVYVDGIYLMQPANTHARMGRYEKAAYMVDELKTIAYRTNRPVVVTTQFGRDAGSGGKRGSMENIGYTDAFSTHASLILGIKGGKKVHVPKIEYVRPDGSTRILREARDTYPYREIEILKGREGESGSFGCNYSFGPTNFQEVPLASVRERETGNDIARPE